MKVKIGKYPYRLTCNVFTNHMNNTYGFCKWPKAKDYTNKDRFLEKLEDTVQSVYSRLNWLIFDRLTQKVSVRIDCHDTWCMPTTLSPIILPMLKQLKNTKHGAPNVDVDDVPEELRPSQDEIANYNTNGTTDPKFFKRWDWIMDEMIFAFESTLDESWEEQFYSGTHDRVTVPLDENGNETTEDNALMWRWDTGPADTFEIDFDGLKAYNARIDNGFRLFGKYFRSLWD